MLSGALAAVPAHDYDALVDGFQLGLYVCLIAVSGLVGLAAIRKLLGV